MHSFEKRAFKALRDRWGQETLSSRAEKVVREADDLRSRGTCCLLTAPMLQAYSRSLHSPVDRLRRSTGSVGMTDLSSYEGTPLQRAHGR